MKLIHKHKRKLIGCGVAFLLFLLIPIPDPLFENPYSTVLEDRNGELLSAKIAEDGQWRFPEGGEVPEKFSTCIRQFEDEYFYYHPGINPISFLRAAKQNIAAGRVVSGGSTLSMQVVRLARKGKQRTFWQKLIEVFWTFRIELRYSKDEILQLYSAHAPFGGNVVGIESASWRYYKRAPDQLSWAESATLAVLPNAPSLIHPGKNREVLLEKRNGLLEKLFEKEIIDETTMELAKSEPLPNKPHALPRDAVHLLNRSLTENKQGQRLTTTIKKSLQLRVNDIVERYYGQYVQNEIHNLAVLVIDNQSNEVVSYVGNSNPNAGNNGHRVDVIMANRSTGSLLKPFLYGLAWQDGLALPTTILPDVPTQFGSYMPKNFNKKFSGAVVSSEALASSLNIPAVRLLQRYRLDRFYDELKLFPMKSVNLGANHYGLSIILGGAESSLWEICTSYKGMSESLRNVERREYQYSTTDYEFPRWLKGEEARNESLVESTPLNAAAIWQLVESLKKVNRLGQEEGWESFAGRKKVAWKTGTSFGLRDAWAVGINPNYTIGVWVGNADGEGRPGLTGIKAAAPVMFEVFNLLPENDWYNRPNDELYEVVVCKESGLGKGLHCPETDTILTGNKGKEIKNCYYHRLVQLNKQKTKRVNSSCYTVADMVKESYFVLPPLMEYYYKRSEPNYKVLPNWAQGCNNYGSEPMELVTIDKASKLFIPVGLNGEKGSFVVEVAHRNPEAIIYWHLNNKFIATTEGLHQHELNPPVGKYNLTLVDHEGNTLQKEFEVVDN